MSTERAHLIDPRITEKGAIAGLWIVAALVMIPLVSIIGYMLYRGGSALSWELLTSMDGLYPAIVGTTYLASLTALIRAPWCE